MNYKSIIMLALVAIVFTSNTSVAGSESIERGLHVPCDLDRYIINQGLISRYLESIPNWITAHRLLADDLITKNQLVAERLKAFPPLHNNIDNLKRAQDTINLNGDLPECLSETMCKNNEMRLNDACLELRTEALSCLPALEEQTALRKEVAMASQVARQELFSARSCAFDNRYIIDCTVNAMCNSDDVPKAQPIEDACKFITLKDGEDGEDLF